MNTVIRNIWRLAAAGLITLAVLCSWGLGPAASAQSQIETDFLILINAERSLQGKTALVYNTSLTSAAYLHSKDMAENHYFSHTSLDGRTFVQRIVRPATPVTPRWVKTSLTTAARPMPRRYIPCGKIPPGITPT